MNWNPLLLRSKISIIVGSIFKSPSVDYIDFNINYVNSILDKV